MRKVFIFLIVCVFFAAFAEAQQGTLSGTLTGLTGNQKAVLILTNVATGASQRVTPANDGTFSTSLPAGTYRVEVERNGSRQSATQNVTIRPDMASQLTVAIQGGPTIEAVEVKAETPGIQDVSSEVGRSYTTNIIRALPVLDRNHQELIGQLSGVTPPLTTFPLTFDPQQNRQYNTNGLPAYLNDSLTDGISVREPFTGEMSIRVQPDEAIQQLNVVTTNYPAQTGFAAGSVSNVFPRPGTNDVHGSLFGFVTDDFFVTRDPFTPAGDPQPTIHNRQFGGTIGGPLVRNKLFYFGSYQGTIFDGSNLQFGTVPTAPELAGNFSGLGSPIYNGSNGIRSPFVNGIIPAASLNPVSLAYLSYLPAANLVGDANNLAANVPYGDRAQVADGRIDYHFSNDWTGFFRYGWSSFNSNDGSIFGSVVSSPTLSTLRNDVASASVAGNYHGVIAEFRVGYSRYRNFLRTNGQSGPLAADLSALGFSSGVAIPSVSIDGLGVLGTPVNLPAKDIDNDYEGSATFHIYRGRNNITFGADVRDDWASGFPNFEFGPAGSFYFGPGPAAAPGVTVASGDALAQSFASFLLGAPTVSGIFSPLNTPNYEQRQYAGFLGDTIRVSSRFTLDLGARYEVYSPVDTHYSTSAAFYGLSSNTVSFGRNVGSYSYTNIAPRIGLAFRLSDRTVIRASYAIQDFPLPLGLYPVNPAGIGTSQGVVGSYLSTPFSVPLATTTASSPASQNIPYDINALSRTPYVETYYFMIQQSAPLGFLADVSYVGNVARELPYIEPFNVAAPGSGLAGLPLASVGQTAPVYLEGNGLTSNYNALQFNLTKRLTKGASFALAYTYSKALDYGTYLLNPFNVAANYGPANWDRPQMLTISHVFSLPFGRGTNRWNTGLASKIFGDWQLDGLFHYAIGAPYNIYANPIACDCPGLSTMLASATSTTNINGQASFNPGLFSLPAANSLGNLGRNAIRGPSLVDYNLSLFKQFFISENKMLELRAEGYNLLNSTQFGTPYSNISYPNFGMANNVNLLNGLFGGAGRTFVLGARILF